MDLQEYGLLKLHNDFTKFLKTLKLDENYKSELEAKPNGVSWHLTKEEPKDDGKDTH